MQSFAKELRLKTLAYWKLSQVWNGRVSREVSTGEAIEICVLSLRQTNHSRPLGCRFWGLMREIVEGEGNGPYPHSKVLELFPTEVEATVGATI